MSTNGYGNGPAAIIQRGTRAGLRPRTGRDDVAGFAVIGQPFASGDLLCLRQFPLSTFGPGYTSVWHRSPSGNWTIYTTAAPEQSCPRFVGAAASRVLQTPIEVEWTGPSDLTVRVPSAELEWSLRLNSTLVTRLMGLMMALTPALLFRSNIVLALMSIMSTAMLGAGRMQLRGHMPNKQWFQAGPRLVWMVAETRAMIANLDLGRPAPLNDQATIGRVPLPQRGVSMMGEFSFEAYQSGRHLPSTPTQNRSG